MKYWQGQSRSYPANFNMVCIGNTVLSDNGLSENYALYYNKEWQYLIDRIMAEGIDGVVFLSGDVHFSEVSVFEATGGGEPGKNGKAELKGKPYRFVEFTSSPLTSRPFSSQHESKTRWDIFPGKMDQIKERNFATLNFTGPLDDRKMTIRYFDTQGALLNQKEDAKEGTVTDKSIFSAEWLKAPQNIR